MDGAIEGAIVGTAAIELGAHPSSGSFRSEP